MSTVVALYGARKITRPFTTKVDCGLASLSVKNVASVLYYDFMWYALLSCNYIV